MGNVAKGLQVIGYGKNKSEGQCLEIEPAYRGGLEGLEQFSHLLIFWWAHKVGQGRMLEQKPYVRGPEKIGVFATRSPERPNPLCLSIVMPVCWEQAIGRIWIPYFDGIDGTPILDIKPYHPSADRVRESKVPAWCAHWPSWYEDGGEFPWENEFTWCEETV